MQAWRGREAGRTARPWLPGAHFFLFGPRGTGKSHADATAWLFPSQGAVTSRLAIPNDLALAGVVVCHQVQQAELDASLHVVLLTSSNGLAITVGSF